MLIVCKFNFKLPVIGFIFVLSRGEKLHDVILGEQGTGNLCENALSEMHIYTQFDLDAKVRISKPPSD